jgi:hypothetical protein
VPLALRVPPVPSKAIPASLGLAPVIELVTRGSARLAQPVLARSVADHAAALVILPETSVLNAWLLRACK